VDHDGRENTLTVTEVIRILRRWVWVIGFVVLMFLGAATGFSVMQTPTYAASATVLIREAKVDGASSAAQGIQFEVEGLKAITPTMARAAVSRPVLEAVIRRLDLTTTSQQMSERLTAEPVADTQFIDITYEDTSPERAQRVVNAVGGEFSGQVSELRPIATPLDAVVWEPAALPNEPVGPNLPVIGGLAMVTGLLLGLLSAFLMEGLSKAGVFRKRYGKR
jgi:capsular polysaccharide biosynthesis protein